MHHCMRAGACHFTFSMRVLFRIRALKPAKMPSLRFTTGEPFSCHLGSSPEAIQDVKVPVVRAQVHEGSGQPWEKGLVDHY